MPGYRHALVCEAPAADAVKALDFEAIATSGKMEVTGDPKAVGASRKAKMPDGGVIEEVQIYREVREDMCSHSYTIEPSNPWGLKGYVGTCTVWPLSEDANKCFVEWKANWEVSGNMPDIGKTIGKMLHRTVDRLSGKGAKM